MRLLPVGADHGGRGAAAGEREAKRRGDRRCDDKHLPLRHLSAHPRGDPHRRLAHWQSIGSGTMSNRIALGRRRFLGTATALGGGFALGWSIPAGKSLAQTAASSGTAVPLAGQEVGIWAVISPDDTTV